MIGLKAYKEVPIGQGFRQLTGTERVMAGYDELDPVTLQWRPAGTAKGAWCDRVFWGQEKVLMRFRRVEEEE